MLLHIANWDKIKDGQVTDVYFSRAVEILKAKDIHNQYVIEMRSVEVYCNTPLQFAVRLTIYYWNRLIYSVFWLR